MFWICDQSSIDNTNVLVTAEQCLENGKAFSASRPTPPASRLGVHKKLGGDTARIADPTDRRDLSCHMMLCLARKAGGKEEEEDTFGVMVFIFPNNW